MFSDRLKQFIDYTGKSVNAFEVSIGVSKGSILKPINNKKTVGTEVLDKIITTYPELNLEWLVSGRGEMLKQSASEEKKSESATAPDEVPPGYVLVDAVKYSKLLEEVLEKKEKESQEQQKQLNRLKND